MSAIECSQRRHHGNATRTVGGARTIAAAGAAGAGGGDVVDLVPRYARAGIAVLPLHTVRGGRCSCGRDCPTPGKHPRLRHGAKDATCDLGRIAEWLARWPDTNWGGVPPHGVIVLDVDPRNGGENSLRELQARHGRLPVTLTACTGSGGRHLWLTHPGPTAGILAAGIDVKKAGGYVVLPPSVHACGGAYLWATYRAVAPAPGWVTDLLAPTVPPVPAVPQQRDGQRDRRDVRGLLGFIAAAPVGQRNSRLYWAACRAHEISADTIALIAAAEQVGLSRTEALATIASAAKAAARRTA